MSTSRNQTRISLPTLATLMILAQGCGESSTTTSPILPPAPPPPVQRLTQLGIEVQGIHSPFPEAAGTISIIRMDSLEPAPQMVTIYETTEGYYAIVWITPARYQVNYTPIPPYRVVPGQSDTRIAVVMDGQWNWLTFAVEAPE